jgi:8-amino-7-oxononanoate synthase
MQAHGTLVCGENGGGVAEAFGVQNEIDIHVGTLSKAIGCHGGFIACRYNMSTHLTD